MRRLAIVFALLAACGPKSKQPSGDTEPTGGGGDDDSGESDNHLAEVSPELDALNTEVGSIRDLPSEERDIELCEATGQFQRMIGDLSGATPQGLDADTWESTVDQLGEDMSGVAKACPDKADAIDASFTSFLDALDGLVEATEGHATGPAA